MSDNVLSINAERIKELTALTLPQLREYAAAEGISIAGLTRKAEIVTAIERAEHTAAAAQETPTANETKVDNKDEVEQSPDETPIHKEEVPQDSETKIGDSKEVEQMPATPPTDEAPPGDSSKQQAGVTLKRVLFASRLLMSGEDVKAVHAALMEHGLHVGTDSKQGIFGAKTAVAVRHFQVKKNLIVDGKVGKFTAAALGLVWEG